MNWHRSTIASTHIQAIQTTTNINTHRGEILSMEMGPDPCPYTEPRHFPTKILRTRIRKPDSCPAPIPVPIPTGVNSSSLAERPNGWMANIAYLEKCSIRLACSPYGKLKIHPSVEPNLDYPSGSWSVANSKTH
jgi:hypothetical protein